MNFRNLENDMTDSCLITVYLMEQFFFHGCALGTVKLSCMCMIISQFLILGKS